MAVVSLSCDSPVMLTHGVLGMTWADVWSHVVSGMWYGVAMHAAFFFAFMTINVHVWKFWAGPEK
jgi:hypothetical protein